MYVEVNRGSEWYSGGEWLGMSQEEYGGVHASGIWLAVVARLFVDTAKAKIESGRLLQNP